MKKVLLFAINVDWYFNLHWKERLKSRMVSGFDTYLCLSETNDINDWNNFNIKKISLSRSSIGIWNNLKTFLGVIKVFRDVNPYAIHSVTVKPNIMFGLLALAYNRPILMTLPGLGSVFSTQGAKASVIQRVLLSLYRLIAKNRKAFFIFENQSDLRLFINIGICNTSNAITVPGSGVDISRFKYSELKGNIDCNFQLLFASRLLKKKGLYDLVDVVSELKQEGFQVTLNVAGLIDNDTLESIPVSQVERWHREGKLNWLGQVDEIENSIPDCHVVVLPTRYGEGVPRILLEANACGRPVIANDVPGCNDFVRSGWNGILVEAGNLHALKKAIKQLKNRDLCKRFGKNGRDLVEQSYTNEHVIECYRKIYQTKLA